MPVGRFGAGFAGVAGLMMAVSFAAAWVPARRAGSVEPARTLRDV